MPGHTDKKKKQVKTRELSKPLAPSTWDAFVGGLERVGKSYVKGAKTIAKSARSAIKEVTDKNKKKK